MLRVVLYYPRALVGNGGMTHAVRNLAEGLTGAGAQVVVVCDGGDPPASGRVTWARLPHVGLSAVRAPLGLGRVLHGADLLVLHSAWVFHNVRAAAAARTVGVPYIVAPRGAYDPMILRRRRAMKLVWWRIFERDVIRHAAGLHVFFESERPHVEALGYRGKLVAAPNGVEVPAGLSWDGGGGGYVLWLGRFDPEHKGLDLLLRALQVLPRSRRPVLRLHGPDRRGQKQNMRRLTRALGLEDSVVIGPPIYGREKWAALSNASAFVYPSRWEAFGNAPAEAVALGVPTLVTPYPLGRYLALRGAAVIAEATPEALACGLEHVLSPAAAENARIGAGVIRREFGWMDVSRSWLRQMQALL